MDAEAIVTIKEFFDFPFKFCSTLGIRLYKWSKSERTTIVQIILLTNLLLHTSLYPILLVIYQINMDPDDILGRTTSLAISLFCVNAVTKILCVAMQHKKLGKIIHKLIKYFPTTFKGQEEFNLHYEFTTMRRVSSIMLWNHLLTAVLFDITPPMTFVIEYVRSGGKKQFNFILPYGIWYPWDYHKIGAFIFTYMTQVLGSYVAVIAYVVPDLLLISVVALANMNFRYISKLIREFHPTRTNEDFKSLGEIMDYHDDILSMIDEVNDVFSLSILLSFFGFGGMLCLVGFNVVAGNSIVDILTYLLFISSILLIMYYLSAYGTKMITLVSRKAIAIRFKRIQKSIIFQSTDVSVALADHSWYDGSVYYQRMLPFPIARAQRPAQLLAYKFFVVSMESFQSLLTTSYQLFTLIKTRYDEQR
ncbi:putative odorant receptor 85d isoform 1-T1 [Glossina fuscipes fuscipes]